MPSLRSLLVWEPGAVISQARGYPMKYTGKLLRDLKDEPLHLVALADKSGAFGIKETCFLFRRAGETYRRNKAWGKRLVRAVNSQDGGRAFLGMFFRHWLDAFRSPQFKVWLQRRAGL
jgi:hypothetical protein